MKRPDLHLHSTASDGVLSPGQLVEEAARIGLTHIALTDHDTMAGVEELRRASLPLTLIPGVELSMRDMHGLHLLGYGLGQGNGLRAVLLRQQEERLQRAMAIFRRLEGMGMSLQAEEVCRACAGTVGRPQIARAMQQAGYVESVAEAFDRYLGEGKPAYVPYERLCIREALSLLRQNGFVPVLAHPCELKLEDRHLRILLAKWKNEGLLGVEVYHPSAAGHGYEVLDRMARELGLLVTGGSDFHQPKDKHGAIGSMLACWPDPETDLNALKEKLDEEKC